MSWLTPFYNTIIRFKLKGGSGGITEDVLDSKLAQFYVATEAKILDVVNKAMTKYALTETVTELSNKVTELENKINEQPSNSNQTKLILLTIRTKDKITFTQGNIWTVATPLLTDLPDSLKSNKYIVANVMIEGISKELNTLIMGPVYVCVTTVLSPFAIRTDPFNLQFYVYTLKQTGDNGNPLTGYLWVNLVLVKVSDIEKPETTTLLNSPLINSINEDTENNEIIQTEIVSYTEL